MRNVTDLTDLPPELSYQIFKYCSQPDLINVARCSTTYSHCVKHILFKHVRIPWKVVETSTFTDDQLDNLFFTTSLRFVSYGLSSLFNKVIWSAVSHCYSDIIGMAIFYVIFYFYLYS